MADLQKILVVDDEPGVLRLFDAILKQGGYSVITTESGKQALTILREQNINLLVLDISMPAPDGFEILRFIREKAPGMRVLAVSGFMNGALLDASSFLGATAVLDKTDAPDALLGKVNALLKS